MEEDKHSSNIFDGEPNMHQEVQKVKEILKKIMVQKRNEYDSEELFIKDAEETVQTNQITCLVFHMLKDPDAEIGKRLGEVCKDNKELGANLALIYHKYELFCNLLTTIEPAIPLAVQILIAYKAFTNEEIDKKMYKIARKSIMKMVEEMDERKKRGELDDETPVTTNNTNNDDKEKEEENESSEDSEEKSDSEEENEDLDE